MANKSGKLFGKINIVDILAVVVVIVLVVGIGYRFTGKTAHNVANTQRFEYVVGIADVRAYTVDALSRAGNVYDNKTGEVVGEIVEVIANPYKKPTTTANGTVEDVEVPGRYDVRIRIATEGRIGDRLYFDGGNREIYIGGNIDWYTKWVQVASSQVKAIDLPEN